MTNNLRVMLWDVRVGGSRRLPLIERVDADAVLLLGVSASSSGAWTDRWRGRYHCAAGLHLTDSPQQRPHGAMIASRWPLETPRVIDELPKPERGLIAQTVHPSGPLTLVAWGAPNAAGEGRAAKMAAYRHMSQLLSDLDPPVLVGVDTNSWFDPPLGAAVSPDPDWRAEHDFLDRDPPHGLVDVFRHVVDQDAGRAQLLAHLRPHGPLTTSYIRRPHGKPRQIAGRFEDGISYGLDRMDRIFASPRLTPIACEVLYHEAIDAGGDHAAVITDLELPQTSN